MKTLASYIVAAMLLVLPVAGIFDSTRAAVAPEVGAYLAGINPQTDWSVMARSAIGAGGVDASFLKALDGSTANDYATYILAITALGRDPRSFGNENLVYGLRQKASNGQIGDASMVSDDIFGLLALHAAGVPSNDSLVVQTVNYLKTNQLADGGWDWSAGATESSIDYTAMGIMALVAAGVAPSDDAVLGASEYLLASQNDDGGFPLALGGASNTPSTAWALSALYALGEDVSFWSRAGKTPVDYLNARQHAGGYFLFDAQSLSADLFTLVSTSYAAIAMAGKYYPVASIAAPPTVTLRIEGQSETICDTEAQGRTSLDVIKSAAGPCGYTYVIQDTQYGPYLTTIAGEAAAGPDGWSYLPNYEMAQVGAGDYVMSEGDELVWYYGAWDDKPLRAVHDVSSVAAGDATTAVVQEYSSGSWQPFSGATLKRGSESFTSNAAGQVSLVWNQEGAFYLVAEADNRVRSGAILVVVGDAPEQASLPLSVTIGSSGAGGSPGPGSTPTGGVSFGVSGDLNFGTLLPGQSGTRQATITNSSAGSIITTASVSGSSLFTGNLTLDNVAPPQWQKSVAGNRNAPVGVTLSVPGSYASAGAESGTLIFWAHSAN
ncbi:MAG: DUF4430 domain-containing protein [Parcubacteria group bacterium]|nr:DUF4430 domain-containing protein [Parcubacteria group bacterium]